MAQPESRLDSEICVAANPRPPPPPKLSEGATVTAETAREQGLRRVVAAASLHQN